MWPAQRLLNTTPPRVATANMSLWELGNTAIMCECRWLMCAWSCLCVAAAQAANRTLCPPR
jgi:hypothetical protein